MLRNGELIKQEIISDNDNSTDDDEGSPGKRPKLCFSPSGNKSMFARKLWTATEKAAVYNGVGKHGVGRWKAIKEDDEFAEVLADRTAVQIKVCPLATSESFSCQRLITLPPGLLSGVEEKWGLGRTPTTGFGMKFVRSTCIRYVLLITSMRT